MHVCMYVRTYVCMYVHTYICKQICLYVCICSWRLRAINTIGNFVNQISPGKCPVWQRKRQQNNGSWSTRKHVFTTLKQQNAQSCSFHIPYYSITQNIPTYSRHAKDRHQRTHSLMIVPGGPIYVGMLVNWLSIMYGMNNRQQTLYFRGIRNLSAFGTHTCSKKPKNYVKTWNTFNYILISNIRSVLKVVFFFRWLPGVWSSCTNVSEHSVRSILKGCVNKKNSLLVHTTYNYILFTFRAFIIK
jgi:hypothetical protein